MDLDKKQLQYIIEVARTAKTVGIDQLIIEQEILRGASEDKMVILLHTENIPEMPFPSIGINDVGMFLERVSVIPFDGMSGVLTMDEEKQFGRSLTIASNTSSTKMSIGYRFGHPGLIRVPKKISDTDIKATLDPLGESLIGSIKQGLKAMKAEKINCSFTKQELTINIFDVNREVMTIHNKLSDSNTITEDFTHSYDKRLIDMLSISPNVTSMKITTRGIINMNINNITFATLPLAGE